MAPTHVSTAGPLQRLLVRGGTAAAALALVFGGAAAAHADPPPPPPTVITSLTATNDPANHLVRIQGTVDPLLLPSGGAMVEFTVVGPGSPVASGVTTTAGQFASSFPVPLSPSAVTYTITAQIVGAHGILSGAPAFASVTVPAEQEGGGGGDGGTSEWTAPKITVTAVCIDPKVGSGDIQYVVVEPAENANGSHLAVTLDGASMPFTVFQTAPGQTVTRLVSESHVGVTEGKHTLSFVNMDAMNDAWRPSFTADVETCAVTSSPQTTGGATAVAASPLTGTAAPQTGARGVTTSPANAIVGLGLGGIAAAVLTMVAIIAYRRRRAA